MNIQEHFDTIEEQIAQARKELDPNGFILFKSTVEAELRMQLGQYPEVRKAINEGDKDWEHKLYY